MDADRGVRRCEPITSDGGPNFSYGIRLLPPAKRAALAAVYALARRIDDIGDGDPARPAARSPRWASRRPALPRRLTARSPDTPTPSWSRSPTPPAASRAAGRLRRADRRRRDGRRAARRYETFEDCSYYCRCVAGSIGRLSLGIFGTRTGRPAGAPATPTRSASPCSRPTSCATSARTIGTGGSTCPPRTWPGSACDLGQRRRHRRSPVHRADRVRGRRARDWYADGLRLLPMLDRRSAACTGAMAGIYRQLLERIAARARAPSLSTGCPCPAGKGDGRRARPGGRADEYSGRLGGTSRPRVVVDRRRPRRHHRRDRARRDGRRRHAARGQAPARRRDLLVQPGRPDRRHRPAHLPRLLHGLPRPAGPARHGRARARCRTAST